MKKKVLALLTFMLMIILTACSNVQAQRADEPLINEPIQISTNITAAGAEDLAIDFIGGGELISLELNTQEGNRVFEIAIDFEDFLYNVLVDLQTGDVISLTTTPLLEEEEESESQDLTEDEAIALASEHLESIGVDDADFVYAYLDLENGVRVWSIEFNADGHEYEFYVNVLTGDFLKAPNAPANDSDYEPTQATTQPPTTQPVTQPPATQPVTQSPTTQPATQSPTTQPVTPSPSPQQATIPPASASPANSTTVSRDQAAGIALEFVPGTLIEVDNDFEHGRAVWYVAIRSGRYIHEVYVDQQTGEIVYHESEIDD